MNLPCTTELTSNPSFLLGTFFFSTRHKFSWTQTKPFKTSCLVSNQGPFPCEVNVVRARRKRLSPDFGWLTGQCSLGAALRPASCLMPTVLSLLLELQMTTNKMFPLRYTRRLDSSKAASPWSLQCIQVNSPGARHA